MEKNITFKIYITEESTGTREVNILTRGSSFGELPLLEPTFTECGGDNSSPSYRVWVRVRFTPAQIYIYNVKYSFTRLTSH